MIKINDLVFLQQNLALSNYRYINNNNKKQIPAADRDTLKLQEEVSEHLGSKVEIKPNKKGGGKLIIEYSSNDHLEEFLSGLRKGR